MVTDVVDFLTIGVPSIKRVNGPAYLLSTLRSLSQRTSSRDKLETVVVVFLADFDTEYNNNVIKVRGALWFDFIYSLMSLERSPGDADF